MEKASVFNSIGMIGTPSMLIEQASIGSLLKMQDEIRWQLSKIKAEITFCKKFKTNPYAKNDLSLLEESNRYYQDINKKIQKRLR
ncbi:MAG: hypothetical protein KKD18_02225 [Nanoarchaeota archaeon]|nr:hypothetical protein [Nanoarchaeota archaeon]